jgi:hypothetical protein
MTDRMADELITAELNPPPTAPPPQSSVRSAGAQSAEIALGLTVEHLLYGVIVLAAVAVRVVRLGAEPLSPTESAAAWSAWLAANATVVAGAPAPVSALFYGAQSNLFWLFGSSDVLARALPLIVSVATVALPWFWRTWLGRCPALVLAALFAIDPWLTAWGRRADPLALTLFLALLTLTALWQWQFAPQPGTARRWERAGAVALALLIASGPWAWGLLPVLLIFALIYLWPQPARALRRSTLAWFGVALALALTGLALRPEAVSALSTSLTTWIGEISGATGGNEFGWPFLRLLLDQPLLAIVGPLGLAALWLRPRDRRLAIFLTAWLAWALLLWLLPGRPAAALPVAGLPLAIAAATLIGRAGAHSWEGLSGLELFTLLVVQTVLLVAGTLWLAAMVDNVVLNNQLWVTSAIIVTLMAAVWIIFGVWAGWRATARVALIFYAVLLAALTVRSGWQLNHSTALMAPNGFWPALTSPDVRNLTQDVERLSSIRRGDPHQIDVQVVYDVSPDPVVGWALREMRNLRHVRTAEVNAATSDLTPVLPLVVAPTLRNESLALPDPYIGSEYDTVIAWQPGMLPQAAEMIDAGQADAQLRWTEFWRLRLRWLFYRTVVESPTVQSVTLWAAR